MKRYCSRCKKEFEENNAFRMCAKCREKNRKYTNEWKERNFDKPKGIDIKNLDEKIQTAKNRGRKEKKSTDSLVLFEFERRAYNAKHGTRLSYGMYRAYKERGWLSK